MQKPKTSSQENVGPCCDMLGVFYELRALHSIWRKTLLTGKIWAADNSTVETIQPFIAFQQWFLNLHSLENSCLFSSKVKFLVTWSSVLEQSCLENGQGLWLVGAVIWRNVKWLNLIFIYWAEQIFWDISSLVLASFRSNANVNLAW